MHRRSTKSELLPPTPLAIAKLAEQSRKLAATDSNEPDKNVVHPYLSRRLSPSDIEAIVARRRAVERMKELCKEYGVSESALSDLMVQAGAPTRKSSITPEDIDMAVLLYESGLTVKQVVKRLGYSIRTIRRVLHQRGVVMRKSGCHRR